MVSELRPNRFVMDTPVKLRKSKNAISTPSICQSVIAPPDLTGNFNEESNNDDTESGAIKAMNYSFSSPLDFKSPPTASATTAAIAAL